MAIFQVFIAVLSVQVLAYGFNCTGKIVHPITLTWDRYQLCINCLDGQDNIFIIKGRNTECIPETKFHNNTDNSFIGLHFVANLNWCGCFFILAPYRMKDINRHEQGNFFLINTNTVLSD